MPLGNSKVSLVDSAKVSKRRFTFQGRWTGGAQDIPNPAFAGSTLRVSGGPKEGDSGLITLADGSWGAMPKGKGYRYDDPSQSAGGIRSILLKRTKKGGVLRITAGKEKWAYQIAGAQSEVSVILNIGDLRFCADFAKIAMKGKGKHASGKAAKAPETCPCESFDSTWAAIQTVIFERRGCLNQVCHGSDAGIANSGTLDLRPGVAYENLVNHPSLKSTDKRIERGSRQDSFFYRKLAAGTLGEPLRAGEGTAMPQGLTPISKEELEAVRLWIQAGAPKDTVVNGTEDLLASCLPPAAPPRIEPPDAPAVGTGVQFHAPEWSIYPAGQPAPAGATYGQGGEDEVCYAVYYNVTDQVPENLRVECPDYWKTPGNPNGLCFAYNRNELTQQPNSHHSIIHLYRGTYEPSFRGTDPTKPGFGFDFRCHNGEESGDPCDPKNPNSCPAGAVCRGNVKSSTACVGYGPPDYGFDIQGAGSDNAPQIGGSQQPFSRQAYPQDVFNTFPLEGVMIFNSHAFNTASVTARNEQWWNIYFADPATQKYQVRGIFDAASIFVQNVPPFEEREYCRTATLPVGARLFQLSSHTHSRGRLFRIYGPGIAQSCVSASGSSGGKECPSLRPGVGASCDPEPPPAQPILVTTEYNDPAVVQFAEPIALDSPDPAQRRLKFCSIYSNGADPQHPVKKNSTTPLPADVSIGGIGTVGGVLVPGGPCYIQGAFARDWGISCIDGPKKGMQCGGDHAVCGPAENKWCDACPACGGVTTQDEMFIMIGSFFCAPNTPCSGQCVGGPKAGQFCNYDQAFCECPPGDDTCRCQISGLAS